jgi:crotonobetainyl-CoA:carnitine CoA-transferase CaiB-like acyl-CoA transferase
MVFCAFLTAIAMTDHALPPNSPAHPPGAAGALAGLTVIDLTRVLGGPYATQILADHGANVIKIEPPQGDETRDWGPPFHDYGDDKGASYYVGVNRNKRAMAMDLTRPEAIALLLQMLEGADVLVDNFKPGSLEAWGLGYESVLKQRFPRLIHCSISGFGASGPYGGLPGYDAVLQAMTGTMSVNGTPESGGVRAGTPLIDITTGLNTTIGILLALAEREKSGLGQFIDIALYDCGLANLHPHAANYFMSGKAPVLTGNSHPNISPYDKMHTATVDIFVCVGNNRAFERFCQGLGRADLLQDERFKTNASRVTHRAPLMAELQHSLNAVDGHAFCDQMLRAGVPVGPVMDLPSAFAHPHTAHRQMRVQQDWYQGFGVPVKLSRTPGAVRTLPPAFGQHTRQVLTEYGLDDTRIQALINAGVVIEHRR